MIFVFLAKFQQSSEQSYERKTEFMILYVQPRRFNF